jgi:hypothetical protein
MPAAALHHDLFAGGAEGAWRIVSIEAIRGDALPLAPRLDISPCAPGTPAPLGAAWAVAGTTSNVRYALRPEVDELAATQPPLGRPKARAAALIPISKSNAWWALAQDERRALFAAGHHDISRPYVPAIARRLYHSRDLAQPFDFLTWFEFAPDEAPAFDRLLAGLRATPEWAHVTREVDIRLSKD